jgi:hypothetical protein
MSSYGKHTRNSGYKPGNHWVVCDVCGFDIRAADAMERWDGLIVCPEDYEERHPQDYVRVTKDTIAAQGYVRTEPTDIFTTGFCETRSSDAGEATAGCAIAGYSDGNANLIPSGTFRNTL